MQVVSLHALSAQQPWLLMFFLSGSPAYRVFSSVCVLSRRRQMAGVIVATPGWAFPGVCQEHRGPEALTSGVVLFRPSLVGGGRPRLLKS